jgi:hypothetical protein
MKKFAENFTRWNWAHKEPQNLVLYIDRENPDVQNTQNVIVKWCGAKIFSGGKT